MNEVLLFGFPTGKLPLSQLKGFPVQLPSEGNSKI
jgi:hypothetical protein